MSYLVLARKYRPATFEEVVGQEHVTRTLRNAIKSGRIGHAFLFSGLRGVGKTSVARILAKTLNCSDDKHTDEPCGQCASCTEIDEGRSLDVVEMDAASHTSVDDIRELRESVVYAAGGDRYKVYIIDEVHMLSRNAFNALLKTLEEPPPRVVFILATTEPHKVPITIHSRCQRYDFRRIPSASMADHLSSICAKEGVTISRDSLRRIAIAAEGSLRDSQSILDQVLSYSGQDVADEDVNLVLGSLDRDMLMEILSACVSCRPGEALTTLGDMIDKGADPLKVAMDLMEIMRSLMILVEVPDSAGLLDLAEGEMAAMKEVAQSSDPAVMRIQFAMLARGEERMRRSSQPRFHLELALVHMANAHEIVPIGQVETGVKGGVRETVRKSGGADTDSGPGKPASGKEVSPVEGISGNQPAGSAGPAFAGIDTPEETWDQLLNFVSGKAPSIGSLLEQLIPLKVTDEEVIVGGRKGELCLEVLQEKDKTVELQDLMKEFFNRDVAVRFREMDQEEREKNHNSVEKRQKKESDLARKIRRETREHPAVVNALDLFQGEIESVRVLGQAASEVTPVENKEEEDL
jgi:DNA polymerase-3 subunit gamma/tau